jgi:hypothetical protein
MSACFTGGIPQSPKHTVYTLYLEDVQLPDEIHANEPFTLRLVYSASQNPGVFMDSGLYWGSAPITAPSQEVTSGKMFFLHDDVNNKITEKTPNEPNVVSLGLNYSEPGMYVLLIGTVAERSMGGEVHALSFSPGIGFLSGDGHYSHREVVLNILP